MLTPRDALNTKEEFVTWLRFVGILYPFRKCEVWAWQKFAGKFEMIMVIYCCE